MSFFLPYRGRSGPPAGIGVGSGAGRSACAMLLLAVLLWTPARAGEKIGALGRIRPEGTGDGVIRLAGQAGDPIETILVSPDQVVEKGAPLVIFASRSLRAADAELAELALKEAEGLGALTVAEQMHRIEALRALAAATDRTHALRVAAAEENFQFARSASEKFDGADDLFSEKQVREGLHRLKAATIGLELARAERDRSSQGMAADLKQAEAILNRLRQVREGDIRRARNRLALARQQLARSTLTAPVKGRVLEIFKKPGEASPPGDLMSMADLEQMVVVADVYEKDLLKIAVGMPAKITSGSLPAPLQGTVTAISRIVNPHAKVAQVKIRLADAETASRLIHLEVDVAIGH